MYRIKIAFLAVGLITGGCLVAMDSEAVKKTEKMKETERQIKMAIKYIKNNFDLRPEARTKYQEEYNALMNNEFLPSERLGKLKLLLEKIEKPDEEGTTVEGTNEEHSTLDNAKLDKSQDTQNQKPQSHSVQVSYRNITIVGGTLVIVAIGAGIYAYLKKTKSEPSVTRKPELDEAQEALTV